MKRISTFALCLFALTLTTAAFAQNANAPQQGRNRQRAHSGGKLRKMDANNDGAVSRDEWKGKPKGFERIDRDNDNIISRDEAMAAGKQRAGANLRQMDENKDKQISRNEWKGDQELFGRLDSNNDGVISRDELKARRGSRP
jgi:Ca2+-binding EF-hand superfamily protein